MVHTSYQFPNAGDGLWLKSERGRRQNIMISPVITVSNHRVKDLSVAKRGCVFPDERELYIYHVYTQSSCLIQCRMEYVLHTCGCHMYFFNSAGKCVFRRCERYDGSLFFLLILLKKRVEHEIACNDVK